MWTLIGRGENIAETFFLLVIAASVVDHVQKLCAGSCEAVWTRFTLGLQFKLTLRSSHSISMGSSRFCPLMYWLADLALHISQVYLWANCSVHCLLGTVVSIYHNGVNSRTALWNSAGLVHLEFLGCWATSTKNR